MASGKEITLNELVFDALADTDYSCSLKDDEAAYEGLKGSERDMILSALRDSNGKPQAC